MNIPKSSSVTVLLALVNDWMGKVTGNCLLKPFTCLLMAVPAPRFGLEEPCKLSPSSLAQGTLESMAQSPRAKRHAL